MSITPERVIAMSDPAPRVPESAKSSEGTTPSPSVLSSGGAFVEPPDEVHVGPENHGPAFLAHHTTGVVFMAPRRRGGGHLDSALMPVGPEDEEVAELAPPRGPQPTNLDLVRLSRLEDRVHALEWDSAQAQRKPGGATDKVSPRQLISSVVAGVAMLVIMLASGTDFSRSGLLAVLVFCVGLVLCSTIDAESLGLARQYRVDPYAYDEYEDGTGDHGGEATDGTEGGLKAVGLS